MPVAALSARMTRTRFLRRVGSQSNARLVTNARLATPNLFVPSLKSRSRARSFVIKASDDGGAPSLSVNDEDATSEPKERTPKALDLSTVPRPPLKIAAALAATGALESSYLAFEKLTNGNVTCPLTGCQTALSSGYSMLFGQPLSAYGAVSYALVAALAWWGAGMADEVFDEKFENPSDELNKIANSYSKARGLTCLAGAGLAGVSTYLLYVLAVPLGGAECIYCLTSAALSFSIFAIGWSGLSPKQAASTAPAAIAIYAVVVLTSYLAIGSSAAKEDAKANMANLQLSYAAPVIDNKSTAYSRELAIYLQEKGAKMYGAFWCSHCEDQKEIFGNGAEIPYVECFPDGWERGRELATSCKAVEITGFPTWILPDGTRIEGERELAELAKATGFRAPPADASDAASQLDSFLN